MTRDARLGYFENIHKIRSAVSEIKVAGKSISRVKRVEEEKSVTAWGRQSEKHRTFFFNDKAHYSQTCVDNSHYCSPSRSRFNYKPSRTFVHITSLKGSNYLLE